MSKTAFKYVRKVSLARAKQQRQYAKLKAKFLAEYEHCFSCAGFVPEEERELHHFYKRRGRLLAWLPGFRMACDTCHSAIHHNEPLARFVGLLAPKECCDDFARAVKHHEKNQ